jgi:hypothetical protein
MLSATACRTTLAVVGVIPAKEQNRRTLNNTHPQDLQPGSIELLGNFAGRTLVTGVTASDEQVSLQLASVQTCTSTHHTTSF